MTQRILLVAALRLELPGHIVRLIDGGTLVIAGEEYGATDPLLGVPDSFDALTEGVGDEAPAGTITFLPPDDAPAALLNSPANQNARLQLMVAEVDADTGLVIGAVDQLADWIVDTTELRIGMGQRELEITFVSGAERLFQTNRGNCLSPVYHQSVHPGETGLDNASGVEFQSAWGAPSARGVTAASGSGGGGGGFGGQVSELANVSRA